MTHYLQKSSRMLILGRKKFLLKNISAGQEDLKGAAFLWIPTSSQSEITDAPFFCSFVLKELFVLFGQTIHINFHAKSAVCSS